MALFGVAYIDYQWRCATECRASQKPEYPSTELPEVEDFTTKNFDYSFNDSDIPMWLEKASHIWPE